MKLVPEQIKYLRDRKKILEQKRKEYQEYLEGRDKTGFEKIGMPQYGDFASDMEYRTYLKENQEVDETLATSTFQSERNYEFIDIGTLFQVRFEDEDETEDFMLVEKGISHDSMNLVSLESDLGKAVEGRREKESITYTVKSTGRKISITIQKIETMREKYEHFIRERKTTDRMSDPVKKELRELKASNIDEYNNRHAITASQLELAKEELAKIPLRPTSQNDIGKRSYLNKIITTSKVVTPPEDDTIGVGSEAEILLTDENGNNKEMSFEFINAAVSTELESQYVERISPLGNAIFGLRKDDTFQVPRKNKPKLKGIVVSVNNKSDIKRVR